MYLSDFNTYLYSTNGDVCTALRSGFLSSENGNDFDGDLSRMILEAELRKKGQINAKLNKRQKTFLKNVAAEVQVKKPDGRKMKKMKYKDHFITGKY